MKVAPVFLANSIQSYAWGTRGPQAFLPRLVGLHAEPGAPYAELWIGIHPNAPSRVRMKNGGEIPLAEWLSVDPEALLGRRAARKFSGRLPFLLKVISIAEALSIQAHPGRLQARVLHRDAPHLYPDENHKPEIAVVLDVLEALMGFRSPQAIRHALASHPELDGLIGPLPAAPAAGFLRRACAPLLDPCAAPARAEAIRTLSGRLRSRAGRSAEENLFLELAGRYPQDGGPLWVFFLEMVHLTAGQAVFIPAGVPHAYLRGNLVECMANSDNVVRAGLTGKPVDLAALGEVLDYAARPVFFRSVDLAFQRYETPCDEFLVSRAVLQPGQSLELAGGESARIILSVRGKAALSWQPAGRKGCVIGRGQSLLVPAALRNVCLRGVEETELYAVEIP